MQALPSSSVATAVSPQSDSAAKGRINRGATGLPVFAQIVHETLNRAANSSAGPLAVAPSKVGAVANATDRVKKPRQSGRDEALAQGTSDGPSAVNTVLLPSLLLALGVPNPNQQGQTDGAPLGNISVDNRGAEPGMTSAEAGMTTAEPVTNSGLPGSAVVKGDRASTENDASPPTASGVPAEQIQAQLSEVLSAPLFSPVATASVGNAPPTTSNAAPNSQARSDPAAGQSAGEPQTKAQTLREPELALAVGDPLSSSPAQDAQLQHKNAGTQPSASPAGDPPSSPLSPGAQLQHANAGARPSAPPVDGTPTQAGSQPQQPGETQQVSKSILAPLPVLGTKPAALSDSRSMPRGLQTAIDEGHAALPAQVPSASSSGPGGSQDASANHKEPARPYALPAANVSFPASATHDVMGGSQPLAASQPAKQEGAPMPATAANVVASPPVATFDRATVAVTTSHSNAPAAAPAPFPSPEGADVAANHFVSNAKLVEAAGHSEMRIAMETEKLGAVELRARMVGDEVGAAITVEKRDAHAVLAVELPALQQALSDKQLRIEQVTLSHGSFSSTTGDASGSTKQDERSGPHAASRPWSVDGGRLSSMFGGGEQSGIFDSHGRLSVRA